MKRLLSGAAVAAVLTCGLPAWSLTSMNPLMQPGTSSGTSAKSSAITGNEPGYNFSHPWADADNVPVKVEQKHDGISKPMNSAQSTGSQSSRTAQNTPAGPASARHADVD